MVEFHIEKCRLNPSRRELTPVSMVVVFALGAVIGQSPNMRLARASTARQNGTSVPKGAEVLAWEEARCSNVSQHARRSFHGRPSQVAPKALGVVFDDMMP